MKITLNNRHKTGLFLTTLIAGLSLIMGETFRETLGVVIIGCALTWAYGSTSRMLRYCIGSLGILVFLTPLIAGGLDHHTAIKDYEQSLDTFKSELPQFAREHPDLSAGIIPPPPGYVLQPRTLAVPDVGEIQFPGDMSGRNIAATLRKDKDHGQPPDWYYLALDAGVDPSQMSSLMPPRRRPKSIDIWQVFGEGMFFEIPAAILVILFFGSIVSE